jgi:hypothetical protein
MPGIIHFIFKTMPVVIGSIVAAGIAGSTAVAFLKQRQDENQQRAYQIQQQYEQQCQEEEEYQRQQQQYTIQCKQTQRHSVKKHEQRRSGPRQKSCSPKKKIVTWLTRPRLELLKDVDAMTGSIFVHLKTLQVLKVTYPYDKRVCLGNKLRISDTTHAPKVQVHRHSSHHVECVETQGKDQDGYYTLMMLDPDAPSKAVPSLRNILHWLVVNIPVCDSRKLAIRSGNTLAVYVPPNPSAASGYHRYVFILYWQREFLDVTNIPIIGKNEIQARLNFNPGTFASRFATPLTLIEFNYFLTNNNTVLAAISPPTALIATVTGNQIKLSWTDNSNGEARFLIERSTDNQTFILLTSLVSDITSYNDTNLSFNTTYYYRVRAKGGRSIYANMVTAKTGPALLNGGDVLNVLKPITPTV